MTKTFKFSWGTGIFLFYGVFVVIMISFVVVATRQKIELVTEDYYEQGIDYQNTIEEQKNTAALAQKPRITETATGNAQITYNHAVKGNIAFFRPSDKDLDFSVPLDLKAQGEEQTIQIIDKPLKAGLWRVRLSWTENQQDYFQESVLVISE